MSALYVTDGERKLSTPAPVRFVHNDRFGAAEAAAAKDFTALLASRDDIRRSFAENGDLCWTVQTWCRLREMGIGGIELATAPAEGRINLAKAKSWSRRGADPALFQVSIQADYPRILWAQFHIQQNADQLCDDAALQYLWPQAGIVPRSMGREGVRRIGFLGNIGGNLASNAQEWSEALAGRGFEFVAPEADRWHDYSELDVVIGLRSFGRSRHSRKPANKLINAWIAGVPFIGGNDSAFSQVGIAGVDHLLAHNREEAIEQIVRLSEEPDLYRALVSAGRKQARRFTMAAIGELWVELLEKPVSARCREWETRKPAEARRTWMLGQAQKGLDLGKAGARRMLGRATEA